jgi:Tetratricopeptide repeat
MIIRQHDFSLDDKVKGHPYHLLLYLLFKIYQAFFSLIAVRIAAVIILLIIMGGVLTDSFSYGFNRAVALLIVIVNLVLIPMIISLEEFCHAAVSIQIGKTEILKSYRMRTLETESGRKIAIASFSMVYEGRFTAIQMLKIRLGGPIGSLSFFGLAAALLFIFDFPGIWFGLLLGALIPIGSLIPIQFMVQSDGYSIRSIRRELHLTWRTLIVYAAECCYLVARHLLSMGLSGRYAAAQKLSDAAQLFSAKRYEEAKGLLLEVLEGRPDDPEANNNLALVYIKLGGNMKEAEVLASRALQKNPDDPQFNDTMGQIYIKLGNRARGLEFIRKAGALAPNDKEIRKHLDFPESED